MRYSRRPPTTPERKVHSLMYTSLLKNPNRFPSSPRFHFWWRRTPISMPRATLPNPLPRDDLPHAPHSPPLHTTATTTAATTTTIPSLASTTSTSSSCPAARFTIYIRGSPSVVRIPCVTDISLGPPPATPFAVPITNTASTASTAITAAPTSTPTLAPRQLLIPVAQPAPDVPAGAYVMGALLAVLLLLLVAGCVAGPWAKRGAPAEEEAWVEEDAIPLILA